MKAVGVEQLRAKLSEYIQLAKAGETILVTDRDEVVAELRPARQPRVVEKPDDVLEALAESGDITRARIPKLDWTWRVKGLGLPEGTAERALADIRGERPLPDA